jgi:hypothetical protein
MTEAVLRRTSDTSRRMLISALTLTTPVSVGQVMPMSFGDATDPRVEWDWRSVTDSATKEPESVAKQFARLYAEWHADVGAQSSITQRTLHPAYLQIIGLGKPVVSSLLADIQAGHFHWFAALRAVTGENPVAVTDRGDKAAMARAWLDWGRRNGHIH